MLGDALEDLLYRGAIGLQLEQLVDDGVMHPLRQHRAISGGI
jgi:hypothetical protein